MASTIMRTAFRNFSQLGDDFECLARIVRLYIEPRWDIFSSVQFEQCRLKSGCILSSAPSSKAKLKSILSTLYNHAIR